MARAYVRSVYSRRTRTALLVLELRNRHDLSERLHRDDAGRGRQVDRRGGRRLGTRQRHLPGDIGTAARPPLLRDPAGAGDRWIGAGSRPLTTGRTRSSSKQRPGTRPVEALAFTSVSKGAQRTHRRRRHRDQRLQLGDPWANLDPGAPSGGQLRRCVDLQTVMTHEFGHFLGLAHTCAGSTSGRPRNDSPPPAEGRRWATDPGAAPIPPTPPTRSRPKRSCGTRSRQESTTKRVLTTDDVRGVCAIYPPARDPHACTQNLPDDGCGCATAGELRRTDWRPLALARTGARHAPPPPNAT